MRKRARKKEAELEAATTKAFEAGLEAATMTETSYSPEERVLATSIFKVGDKVKCAGALSALPYNPHAHRSYPPFRVCFNGEWILVEIVEWYQDKGWIAEAVHALDAEFRDVAPKVELRR